MFSHIYKEVVRNSCFVMSEHGTTQLPPPGFS